MNKLLCILYSFWRDFLNYLFQLQSGLRTTLQSQLSSNYKNEDLKSHEISTAMNYLFMQVRTGKRGFLKVSFQHRVQRLMLSKGAFETISHDFRNIFDKWLSHGGKTSIKMIHLYIKFVQTTFKFRKHCGAVLTEEIRKAKFLTLCLWCRNIKWPNLIYINNPYTCLHSV